MKLPSLLFSLFLGLSVSAMPLQASADNTNPVILGEYLAGSYANYLEDKSARSDYYSRAFYHADKDIRLGRLAMVSAIETGDMKLAVSLANKVIKTDKQESLARAILGVQAFNSGKNSRASKYFSPLSADVTMTLLMKLVQGWNEVERGNPDVARTIFSNLNGANYFDAYGQLQIAKLETQLGNYDAAQAAFEKVEATNISAVETVISRAYFYMAQDDREAALKAFKDHDKERDTFGIGAIPYYIKLLESGNDLPKLSPNQQAARALTDPSLRFFFARRSVDGAEIYLRFARWIDPNYDKAAIWLGDLLDNTEREDEAYDMTKQIGKNSPYYVPAQLSTANYFFAREDDDQALKILEGLSQSHPSFITREALGRARLIREDYQEALPFYTDIINSMSDEDLKDNIAPLRNRGIIYENIDQWDLAEKDFKRVLSLVPDDVDTLNYLGYTWVDRGENLTEAFEMIRKAVAAEPESGAIVDSLGWAHYKLGQYKDAKDKLEEAVALSPSSATIIDHLGDVYWKLGRKREASFQWKRALEFDPTDEEKTAIDIKLKSGLEAALRAQ